VPALLLGVLLLSLSCDRVLLTVSQYFARGLVFPISALLHGPVEGDSPRKRAIINTTAAIPALVRVEDNRWLTFDWIRNIYVHLAYLHAIVATATNFGLKVTGLLGVVTLGIAYTGFLGMANSLFPLINTYVVFIIGLVVGFHIAPISLR